MPKPGYTCVTLKTEVVRLLKIRAREEGLGLNELLLRLLHGRCCPSEPGVAGSNPAGSIHQLIRDPVLTVEPSVFFPAEAFRVCGLAFVIVCVGFSYDRFEREHRKQCLPPRRRSYPPRQPPLYSYRA